MEYGDRKPDVDQRVIDEVLASVTDTTALNDSVDKYVRQVMHVKHGDPIHDTEEFWEIYALRTKEIVIAALAQL